MSSVLWHYHDTFLYFLNGLFSLTTMFVMTTLKHLSFNLIPSHSNRLFFFSYFLASSYLGHTFLFVCILYDLNNVRGSGFCFFFPLLVCDWLCYFDEVCFPLGLWILWCCFSGATGLDMPTVTLWWQQCGQDFLLLSLSLTTTSCLTWLIAGWMLYCFQPSWGIYCNPIKCGLLWEDSCQNQSLRFILSSEGLLWAVSFPCYFHKISQYIVQLKSLVNLLVSS